MEPDKEERSRVLVIGGTGHIGKHIVAASVRHGHSTSVLVRDAAPPDPAKAQLLTSFVDSGVALIKGDLFNHESLVKAIKSTDIVISAVGPRQLAEQTRIVTAIKEAGNVKRFLPSEFGSDVERVHTVDPVASLYAGKVNLRRLIEAEGIPHTYVCCNGFAETYLPSIGDVTAVGSGPPSDKIIVLGDGDTKGKLASFSLYSKSALSSMSACMSVTCCIDPGLILDACSGICGGRGHSSLHDTSD
uniref:Uncharacterized protein n=1 Tax=Avena sativa TaxID=4498 RepID=A0ACD5TRH7_AVESA